MQRPRIVILTGAGISAESGVPTFRDAGGLWEGHRFEDVASPQGFCRDPVLVHRFYNQRRADVQTREPNAAHQAIARLQRERGESVLLVTQNVDDLHERGGSPRVLHMHGELLRSRCSHCDDARECRIALSVDMSCDHCGHTSALRPDIVWFGEYPKHLDEIEEALQHADIFAAIGTSGTVFPAAGFVDVARAAGSRTVEINLQRTEISPHFDEHYFGPSTRMVDDWVNKLLGTERAIGEQSQ